MRDNRPSNALPTRGASGTFSPTVSTLRPLLLLLCGLALIPARAAAAVLVGEYALRGTLADAAGNNPLTAAGGQITSLGYVFAANQGLSFTNHDFTPTNYTIELSFRLNTTQGDTKVMDFHNLTSDPGVYVQNGTLAFTPITAAPNASLGAATDIHLVLTRDSSTNVVTAFVNGQQSFSFLDTAGEAAMPGLSNRLSLFIDDSNSAQASGGTVNYLRVYNGSMSSAEVSAIYAAGPPLSIPEPSVTALLLAGSGAFVATRGWRKWRTRAGKR